MGVRDTPAAELAVFRRPGRPTSMPPLSRTSPAAQGLGGGLVFTAEQRALTRNGGPLIAAAIEPSLKDNPG